MRANITTDDVPHFLGGEHLRIRSEIYSPTGVELLSKEDFYGRDS